MTEANERGVRKERQGVVVSDVQDKTIVVRVDRTTTHRLYGKTIRQRAKALIDVAHPDFRPELERKAIELRYI